MGASQPTASLETLLLDVFDHLDGSLLDVCHVLSVRVLAEVLRCANNDVESVNTGINGQLDISHVTANVWQGFSVRLLEMVWNQGFSEAHAAFTHE